MEMVSAVLYLLGHLKCSRGLINVLMNRREKRKAFDLPNASLPEMVMLLNIGSKLGVSMWW